MARRPPAKRKPPAEPVVAEQVQPEDCPPQTGVTGMGQKVRVNVSSTLPPAKAEWEVDVGDDPKQAMVYTNLAYDLIAVAMGKLGVEMSKWILSGDSESFNKEMDRVMTELKAGSVAG